MVPSAPLSRFGAIWLNSSRNANRQGMTTQLDMGPPSAGAAGRWWRRFVGLAPVRVVAGGGQRGLQLGVGDDTGVGQRLHDHGDHRQDRQVQHPELFPELADVGVELDGDLLLDRQHGVEVGLDRRHGYCPKFRTARRRVPKVPLPAPTLYLAWKTLEPEVTALGITMPMAIR